MKNKYSPHPVKTVVKKVGNRPCRWCGEPFPVGSTTIRIDCGQMSFGRYSKECLKAYAESLLKFLDELEK